ncbi:MAG: hypothetical protein ACK4TC_18750 [Sphingomonas pseudosanguinis]|uniref:hypothetical protein n=1 Tax=Sphingomonas pseudosanguinis TaxID=413712 RepID=UPI00391A004D
MGKSIRLNQAGRAFAFFEFVLLLALLAAAGSARAQGRLVIEPSAVTLTPGGSDRFVVKLEGAGSRPVALAVDSPSGVTGTIAPIGSGRTPARQWIVTMSAAPSFSGDGTAILKASFGGRLVTSTVPVKLRPAPTAASLIHVDLSFEGETLLDGLRRPLLVRVSNLTDAPLRVQVVPRLPPFILAVGEDFKKVREVPARSTVIVEMPIETNTKGGYALLSGKHEVAVVVAARGPEGSGLSGQTVATATLSVGVPGMAEVQGILQIPSFLLFPGFILVTAFTLTRRASDRGAKTLLGGKGALGVEWSSGLWLVAITLSMLMVPAYPLLSWLLRAGWRNILYGFDLGDVMRVWLSSLIIGVLAALIWQALTYAWALHLAKKAFSERLTPLEALDRLAKAGRSVQLPLVTLDDASDSRLYHLGGVLPDAKTWAAPAIGCEVVNGAVGGADALALAKVLRTDDAAKIKEYFVTADQSGSVRLTWQKAGDIAGIAKVAAAIFADAEEPRSIIVRK